MRSSRAKAKGTFAFPLLHTGLLRPNRSQWNLINTHASGELAWEKKCFDQVVFATKDHSRKSFVTTRLPGHPVPCHATGPAVQAERREFYGSECDRGGAGTPRAEDCVRESWAWLMNHEGHIIDTVLWIRFHRNPV